MKTTYTNMIIDALLIIPDEGEISRADMMDGLEAWREKRYDLFSMAMDNLREYGYVKSRYTGQGIDYRITPEGKEARAKIKIVVFIG